MRGDAITQSVVLGMVESQRRQHVEQLVRPRQESPLLRQGWLRAEAAVFIQRGQQREPNARIVRGRDDALAELESIGIRAPVLIVMQVMELADRGVAALEHLDVELCRDRLQLVWTQRERESVHQSAPAPEIVLTRHAIFGEPRHRTLKRM